MMNAWETILLNQFHDIIPGSSINEVYVDSVAQYEEIGAVGNEIINDTTTEIANNVEATDGYVVFNPHSFANSGAVLIDGKYYYVENIPAKGYKVINPVAEESKVSVTENSIENDFFRLVLDEKGTFTSIYDKRNNREVLKNGARGNVLTAYEDYPREYDNWEMSSYYVEKHWEADDVESVEILNEGERAGLKITKKYKNSTIVQSIYLYNNIDKIDFENFIEWKESHIILKTAFPVDVNTNKATYDIQFGSVERPTHKNTSWDAARFEVCAHKYCDLSEYGYGVSLLNDCKYGHAIHDGVMSLTLIKCGTFPDPEADKCEHTFTYSLYPHAGDYREAGTIQKAYDLNLPMVCVKAGDNKGTLQNEYSLFTVDCDNVIFETAKKAETEDSIILRGCEYFNKRTTANVKFGFNVKKAYLCDMLENNIQELDVKDNTVTIDFKPFEINTVKIVK
jgi:alpha-mannosidase